MNQIAETGIGFISNNLVSALFEKCGERLVIKHGAKS